MVRSLSLIVFANGMKPAHWAIWIPTTGQLHIGKVLHVTGSPAIGFFLEFKRQYDLRTEDRNYQILYLAQVSDSLVADTPSARGVDTIARDRLESIAVTVTPPGRSVNPFDPTALNCQNWIVDFVEKLIVQGHISVDARTVLRDAPKKL